MRFLKLSMFLLFVSSCAKPIADFSYSGDGNTAPVDIHFENKSKKGETYEWDFGDGNQSSEVSPVHRYTASGNYAVVLKAKKGEKTSSKEKKVPISAPEKCLVRIITDYGVMLVELYDATPLHRDNFVKLAEEGYYDGLIFHRVINGFMIQGGDPDSRNAKPGDPLGAGGPSYQIPAEFVDSLFHIKGALAAARTNNPEKKSSGSQFYIVQGKKVDGRQLDMVEAQRDFHYSKDLRELYLEMGGTPQLDREYTVFGRVVEGIEVIDKIAAVKTDGRDRPLEDVKMKIEIIK